MELSVIIVNYNVRHFLENAIHSIKRAIKDIEAEIFVVDNASDDGSVEMLREKFPEVQLITNPINLGFAAGNNIALIKAKGKYIALINPDTVVQEDTFTSLIDFLQLNKNVGLVGCKILNPDGTLQLACRRSFPTPWTAFTKVVGLASLFPDSKIFGKYNLTYLNPDKTYEVDAVSGSFMFLRREAYDQVGGLDESYFMYGEDLDWCYRIQKTGWRIFYYPETKIIHYKGESTRRSNIDELKMFYDAMHIFVRKHLSHSMLITLTLRTGIFLAWLAVAFKNFLRLSVFPILDWLLIILSILLGFYLRFNEMIRIPSYAMLPIVIIPGLIVVATIHFFEGYYKYRHSIPRSILSVIIGFTIISALTFFFKQFAFSRIVVGYAAGISILLLSFWRIVIRLLDNIVNNSEGNLLGRKTLLVGIDDNTSHILEKIKSNPNHDYQVIGLIDLTHKHIGDNLSGVPIVGSLENINKVIDNSNISDVIFSTDTVSYKNILNVMAKYTGRHINYRMVTNSLDVIIAKTHIDQLNGIPLIDIDYRLSKPFNRFIKRIFDIVGSITLWIFFAPMKRAFKEKIHYNSLSRVLSGTYSIVGNPIIFRDMDSLHDSVVKPGLTGLMQINKNSNVSTSEIERYNLLYAKNYSLVLDFEILIKTIVHIFKTR
jgi:GT2 family glycosyltransferase/lipopolysaccharide/colanic/teichoic acid biosynthesis glycosyltransferase